MSSVPPTVSFVVAGKKCRGVLGASLLSVIRQHGFEVPSLCHHPQLSPYGACRLCQVEVQKGKKRLLTTSCNYPVAEGIEVHLDTDRVIRHRRMILELLLAMAPHSDSIRSLAAAHQVGSSRFLSRPGSDNCILCGLCTRVCREKARAEALTLAGRGEQRRLGRMPFDDFPGECIACGACAHICPTGSISMEETAVARWRDRWGEARPCRYDIMGLLPGTVCENDYRCSRCEVDQRMMDRSAGNHPVFLSGSSVPAEESKP